MYSEKKGDNGKCAGYATATPFDVVEAVSLPMTTSAKRLNYTLLHGLAL